MAGAYYTPFHNKQIQKYNVQIPPVAQDQYELDKRLM